MRRRLLRIEEFEEPFLYQSSLAARTARETNRQWRAHYRLARHQIERMLEDPASLETLVPVAPPPGSPIGDLAPTH